MKRIAISNYTCPVISFCKINDIMLNTVKINKYMPPQLKTKKTFGYTHEQIAKLLEIADERMRLVCHFWLANVVWNWGNPFFVSWFMEESKGLYKITIYENQLRIHRFRYFRIKEGNPVIPGYATTVMES